MINTPKILEDIPSLIFLSNKTLEDQGLESRVTVIKGNAFKIDGPLVERPTAMKVLEVMLRNLGITYASVESALEAPPTKEQVN